MYVYGYIVACTGVIFFVHRYVFINVWIMLNVLVGILVDSYLKASVWASE